jgi:hypothetical protein
MSHLDSDERKRSAKDGGIWMQTKVKKELVTILLLVSVLVTAQSVSMVNAADSSIFGVTPGQRSQWLVMDSSNVTLEWIQEDFTHVAYYQVPVGSIINLTITNTVGNRCNGTISIGNLTRTNVPMSEVSFNLILGWWPFQPGLVCPINWDVQKLNATQHGFTVTETTIGGIQAITFKYLIGSQGTILVYDKTSGLLLNGYGKFTSVIEVALVSTDIDVGSIQSGYQSVGTIYLVVEIITVVASAAIILVVGRSVRRK